MRRLKGIRNVICLKENSNFQFLKMKHCPQHLFCHRSIDITPNDFCSKELFSKDVTVHQYDDDIFQIVQDHAGAVLYSDLGEIVFIKIPRAKCI